MNVAAALKSEISRVSRKELKSETEPLRKASSNHRSDIAALKRRVAELERLISKLSKASSKSPVAEPEPGESDIKLRFRAAGFAKKRQTLGLSAKDMGALVGVSGLTIYNWESGKSRPRASQLASIDKVRKMGKREAAAALESAAG